MKSQFQIGQQVKAISFTDCFGKVIAETPNLTVSEIRLIECNSMKPYFRVKADGFNGNYIEGAERYFTPMGN